jgi:hypothetical protein
MRESAASSNGCNEITERTIKVADLHHQDTPGRLYCVRVRRSNQPPFVEE